MVTTKSPTERTLIWLRDQGYVADVVERTMRELMGDKTAEEPP